ncbi:thiosulfate oxidation carrier protein SoxY [Zoogloea sp.]|uniref:thiosulfate oxidation carrier protein SoxY n=1 Tax=Zoogloea sp. TaxID=49181 RepID=UPI00260718E1|nr:thiosulfate oxidation carrier protein SoxY [Zoogloea sp.]MDD3353066.1 thiosulfate oxidation carrier protein SoxY [Zoogloea sp.]
MQRRDFVRCSMALGTALALPRARAQTRTAVPASLAPNPAEFRKAMADFIGKAKPLETGLKLDLPVLADNPSAVPVHVTVTLPLSDTLYCKELILLAEQNPSPLACRFQFTPYTGTAEAAARLRLSQSQTVHALARLSDGRVLAARQAITVAASGCGM